MGKKSGRWQVIAAAQCKLKKWIHNLKPSDMNNDWALKSVIWNTHNQIKDIKLPAAF